jgi:hypothetical protein
MEQIDLAYIAGIVDGEGYIGITSDGKKGKRGQINYRLRVTVTNTSEWLCRYLRFYVEGSIVYLRPLNDNRQPCWQWQVDYKKAGNFLKLIVPYMHIKKPQAELAIKFQEAKSKRSTRAKTDEERAIEESQRITLMEMKHKAFCLQTN